MAAAFCLIAGDLNQDKALRIEVTGADPSTMLRTVSNQPKLSRNISGQAAYRLGINLTGPCFVLLSV
jgi:hypothetical protein